MELCKLVERPQNASPECPVAPNNTSPNALNITHKIDNIVNLPIELHQKIAERLDAQDYANLRSTCHTFRNNLYSHQQLRDFASNEHCSVRFRKTAQNLAPEEYITQNRTIMAALTTLKAGKFPLTTPQPTLFSLRFYTQYGVEERQRERLVSLLSLVNQNLSPERARVDCYPCYQTYLNNNVTSYDLLYYLSNDQRQYHKIPFADFLDGFQTAFEKSESLDKYLIAACCVQLIAFCKRNAPISVNPTEQLALTQKYAKMIAAGNWATNIAKAHQENKQIYFQ